MKNDNNRRTRNYKGKRHKIMIENFAKFSTQVSTFNWKYFLYKIFIRLQPSCWQINFHWKISASKQYVRFVHLQTILDVFFLRADILYHFVCVR